MKIMIASDIHGSAFYCNKLIEYYKNSGCQKLVLLGDVLYHGPRNDLPKQYAPKEVIAILNEIKEEILCVRGNCDTEVDQMVLSFPVLADYAVIFDGDNTLYLSHGHKTAELEAKLQNGDVLLCGHTHVPTVKESENFVYINPGSVSIPKENSPNSYIIYENGEFNWYDMEDQKIYRSYSLNS